MAQGIYACLQLGAIYVLPFVLGLAVVAFFENRANKKRVG